jgi:hypothetical protein
MQIGAELFATLANEAEAAPPALRAEIHEVSGRSRTDIVLSIRSERAFGK